MQWWNFHNQEFVVFFSMIVTILVLVIIFILSFSINTKIYQGYLKKIEEGTAYEVMIERHLYKIAKALKIKLYVLLDFEIKIVSKFFESRCMFI